jgi:hypothetical protein
LLNKNLFFNSSTSNPRLPWYMGREIMFQWVSLYFLLWPSLWKKKSI